MKNFDCNGYIIYWDDVLREIKWTSLEESLKDWERHLKEKPGGEHLFSVFQKWVKDNYKKQYQVKTVLIQYDTYNNNLFTQTVS